ncbi:hypothetical protein [Oleidesulfovibrio alaskensis]|uniref:hypothetical protein n=1 Tax=Oleidesulfovibrio alaskensis TaxID=58180 RepID=UPI001A4E4C45|nr:hypothetical protein [Oleidesulfovibrio alaskensis]MBL3583374.1 hypothetical protein [Oleidesulfovibrio alaskensis]
MSMQYIGKTDNARALGQLGFTHITGVQKVPAARTCKPDMREQKQAISPRTNIPHGLCVCATPKSSVCCERHYGKYKMKKQAGYHEKAQSVTPSEGLAFSHHLRANIFCRKIP